MFVINISIRCDKFYDRRYNLSTIVEIISKEFYKDGKRLKEPDNKKPALGGQWGVICWVELSIVFYRHDLF